MKKTLLALFALLACSAAHAEFYVGAGYGLSVNHGSVIEDGFKTKYKDSAAYSLSGGLVMPLPLFDFRTELEYFHTRPETKSLGTKKLNAVMVNATGVIPLIPFIDPYVGMGVGYGRYDHNNSSAWQLLAGVEYNFLSNPFVIGAEYRFFNLTEDGGKGSDKSKYSTHGVMLKLKYTF
ncbi:MAG: porin family protein [Alphaproteobacteria bacterium]|nr:porin family protein [Alphaproteobacteria bacterium]